MLLSRCSVSPQNNVTTAKRIAMFLCNVIYIKDFNAHYIKSIETILLSHKLQIVLNKDVRQN